MVKLMVEPSVKDVFKLFQLQIRGLSRLDTKTTIKCNKKICFLTQKPVDCKKKLYSQSKTSFPINLEGSSSRFHPTNLPTCPPDMPTFSLV
jgi:hypothetical protein